MTPETNPHTPLPFKAKTADGQEILFMNERGNAYVCYYLKGRSREFVAHKRNGESTNFKFHLVPCTRNDELAPQPYTVWRDRHKIKELEKFYINALNHLFTAEQNFYDYEDRIGGELRELNQELEKLKLKNDWPPDVLERYAFVLKDIPLGGNAHKGCMKPEIIITA